MAKKDQPRILLFDIETLPNLKEVMKIYPRLSAYPGLTLKASITSVICFGYKWLGESKSAKCLNAWDYKSWEKDVNDDKEIVKAAYELICDADAVVTQNGKKFDFKFIQTRLMHHKLPLLPKIQHLDTKCIAKQHLSIFNNSLDIMAKFLTDTKKMDNGGWDLWVDVINKEPKALKLMERYCKQDVIATEKVFERLRPLVSNMPNFNIFRRDGIECCPNCGGFNIINNGWRSTATKRYKRIACKDCGTWMHSPTNGKFPKVL